MLGPFPCSAQQATNPPTCCLTLCGTHHIFYAEEQVALALGRELLLALLITQGVAQVEPICSWPA